MPENDVKNQIDVNLNAAVQRVDGWLDSFISLLPNIAVALISLFIFWLIAIVAKKAIYTALRSKDRENLGEVLGGFTKSVVFVLGFLISATIVIPSLNPGDLIAGLGVSSVAIGFAFKDILQNWLAGMLILIRQPFEIDDQIVIGEYEGTVIRIETRSTIIETYDGAMAIVPNSELYTNAILVKTASKIRRSQYDIGISYEDSIEDAVALAKKVIGKIPNIESKPEPEVFVWDLAASWVTIRARWWTDSRRASIVENRSKVILSVKNAFDKAKIDMPYETYVNQVTIKKLDDKQTNNNGQTE